MSYFAVSTIINEKSGGSGVAVSVGLGIGVGGGGEVRVWVEVGIGVSVGAGTGVVVFVGVGDSVGVGVWVEVGDSVDVDVGVLVDVGVDNCTTSKERGVGSRPDWRLFVNQNASPDPKTKIVPNTQKAVINKTVIRINKILEFFLFNLAALYKVNFQKSLYYACLRSTNL